MAQFPMTNDRKSVLERVPDYAVAISSVDNKLTIRHQDTVIAESSDALLIRESRHGDVYYLPRSDVNMELLQATDLSTYCPFKGHASYWSLEGVEDLKNFVWSYEDPFDEVSALKDYMSFYTNKVELIVDQGSSD